MRLEIYIPDERPEAQFLGTMGDASGYLIELVRKDRARAPRKASKRTMPELGDIFTNASNCPSAFKTPEEVNAYVNGLRNEW